MKIVAKVLTLVGIVMLGLAIWTGIGQYAILKYWPTVEAEVADSRLVQSTDDEGKAMYSSAIQFRYSVDGKERLTSATSSIRTSDYASVKLEVDKFAPRTRYTIHYNPSDPNEVKFDVGYTLGFFFVPVLFAGMGIVFAGIGAGVMVASRSR